MARLVYEEEDRSIFIAIAMILATYGDSLGL